MSTVALRNRLSRAIRIALLRYRAKGISSSTQLKALLLGVYRKDFT